ncbi:hypothetical protein SBA2_450123 [Acidobacteriia bacterium SbA2]|nr:hypothetical protein SBA2_450123 [Acidobacteriia bacterium SbA2]
MCQPWTKFVSRECGSVAAALQRPLVLSCVDKRNYSESRKGGALVPPPIDAGLEGPLGPEARPLQGLKPRNYLPTLAAGLKPRPSEAPSL